MRPSSLLLLAASTQVTLADYVPPWVKHQQELNTHQVQAAADRYDPATKTQIVGWKAPAAASPPGPPPPPQSAADAAAGTDANAPAANPPPPPSCSNWCSKYTVSCFATTHAHTRKQDDRAAALLTIACAHPLSPRLAVRFRWLQPLWARQGLPQAAAATVARAAACSQSAAATAASKRAATGVTPT